MSPRALAAALVGALVLLIGALAVEITGASAASAPAQPLMVSTSISRRPSFFGDLLTARTEVLVDANRVDPGSVRVETDFFPYAETSALRRSSSRAGSLVALGYRFTISCLTGDCAPGPGIRRVVLPLLVVRARLRDGPAIVVRERWPQIAVMPRVDDAALRTVPLGWRTQLEAPAVSYRVSPGMLLAALLASAAALVLAAIALVAAEYARWTRLRDTHASTLSRVGLALALARESMRRNPDDRRKALALLARVLDGKDADRLASAAEKLAWSRDRPDPDRMGALADEVEREVVTR